MDNKDNWVACILDTGSDDERNFMNISKFGGKFHTTPTNCLGTADLVN